MNAACIFLQYITPDVWWYYMIELSFYWALMVSQFFDVKRKDFMQMFVHHCATIMLLSFSWACNLTRVGTLVLIVHDVADIFLEVRSQKHCRRTHQLL
jgi:ceramide synthetase